MLKIFTALFVINVYAGARFLTSILEIKKGGKFLRCFLVNLDTCWEVRTGRDLQIKKDSASVHSGAV